MRISLPRIKGNTSRLCKWKEEGLSCTAGTDLAFPSAPDSWQQEPRLLRIAGIPNQTSLVLPNFYMKPPKSLPSSRWNRMLPLVVGAHVSIGICSALSPTPLAFVSWFDKTWASPWVEQDRVSLSYFFLLFLRYKVHVN